MKKIMKGTKPFGEWVQIYEERDHSKFTLDELEELCFERDKGFFTWLYDFSRDYLLIPKMVGDGKYFRLKILEMLKALSKTLGCKGVLFCTKRKPEVYMRVVGGSIEKQEVDENTGQIYSYIFVTLQDTKVGDLNGRRQQQHDSSEEARP